MSKVTVRLAYKINLGNFENMDIDVTFSEDVGDNETPKQVFDRVYQFVEDELGQKVKEEKEGS